MDAQVSFVPQQSEGGGAVLREIWHGFLNSKAFFTLRYLFFSQSEALLAYTEHRGESHQVTPQGRYGRPGQEVGHANHDDTRFVFERTSEYRWNVL